MAREIEEGLRRRIAALARGCCEYRLPHGADAYSPRQIDHMISRKHGGLSELENLALACVRCNAWKGSDIGSITETGRLLKLNLDKRVSERELLSALGRYPRV